MDFCKTSRETDSELPVFSGYTHIINMQAIAKPLFGSVWKGLVIIFICMGYACFLLGLGAVAHTFYSVVPWLRPQAKAKGKSRNF